MQTIAIPMWTLSQRLLALSNSGYRHYSTFTQVNHSEDELLCLPVLELPGGWGLGG